MPTVNRRWGNRVAVRLGDILLGKVFEMNASLRTRDPGPARSDDPAHVRRRDSPDCPRRRFHADRAGVPDHRRSQNGGPLSGGLLSRGAAGPGRPSANAGGPPALGMASAWRTRSWTTCWTSPAIGKSLHKTLGTDLRNAKLTLPLIHALRVLAEPRKTSLLRALEDAPADPVGTARGAGRQRQHRLRAGSDRPVCRTGRGRLSRECGPTPMKAALLEMSRVIVREAVEQSAQHRGRPLSLYQAAARG